MKKLLFLLFFAVALTASAFTPPDGINGNGQSVIIAIEMTKPHKLHLAELTTLYCTDTEVLTVDFAEPGVEYSVTVTNLRNNIYITFYDTGGVVPLPADGFSDYLITIETTDGDVFEGILYAADYAPYLTPWI